jgi:Kef-type K+ transport system membrane component KefB
MAASNLQTRLWGLVGYLLCLGFGLATVAIVLWVGGQSYDRSVALESNSVAVNADIGVNVVFRVLLTLAGVILLGAILGRLCSYIGQPPVIGEIMAGLALGPSLLGAVSPDLMHMFIPTKEMDPKGYVSISLKIIAQLGVILYMFLVGLELSAAKLKHKFHSTVAISHASVVVPFALGTILSLWLYPILSTSEVSFSSFALFLGVAMSITAFPVLARILTDRKLQNTHIGAIALSCAAADDVTAWCLLSLVVGIAKSEMGSAVMVTLGSVAFLLTMFFVVRPILVRYVSAKEKDWEDIPRHMVAGVYVMILTAAALTEWIGIHAIFGAFLLGVMIPSESRLSKTFQTKLKDPVTVMLLPAFFAYTGMRTEIGLLTEWNQWAICGVIILVATAGKFGGTLLAARIAGESWSDSSRLGMLMNTRGLMELIVLNIGLDMGVISPTLFAMMVIMAVVTTVVTSPALQLINLVSKKTADQPVLNEL